MSCPSCELVVPEIGSWAPYGSPVLYCLVEAVKENCKLQFNLIIAIAVIACSAVKAICMIHIIYFCHDTYLVTIGDAIAPFLDEPDANLKNRCLCGLELSSKDKHIWWEMHGFSNHVAFRVEPKIYKPHKTLWARAPTKARWVTTYALYVILNETPFCSHAKFYFFYMRDLQPLLLSHR